VSHPQEALNRALAHHRRGELAQAEAIYRQLLEAEPALADALQLLGFLLHQRGQSEQALPFIQQAIALSPGVAFYHSNLGLVQRALGQRDAALASFMQAQRLEPGSAETCNNLGVVHADGGRNEDAARCFERATALHPDFAEAHNNLGIALVALARHALALASFENALRLRPDIADHHNNLGLALAALGRRPEAIESYRRAVALRPDFAVALSNLALNLTREGAADEAVATARHAVASDPQLAQGWSHLGSALQHSGALVEAMTAFRKAHALAGDSPTHEANFALCLLLAGEWDAGWQAYECRFDHPAYAPLAPPPRCPIWQGEPLQGRSILVMAEQGLGDVIHFARYAPLLKARGARVLLQCQPALRRLMGSLAGVDERVDSQTAPPSTDLAVAMMSLPHRFQTRPDSIPAAVPYLQPELADVLTWRRRLNGLQDKPRVGLAWQGSQTHGADRYRSLPLAALDALADVNGVHFISLQRDRPDEPAGPMGGRLIDLSAELTDMADMAALIANLDLVISVDTSVCHLAGAMARPVWVLLHAGPDFRWLMDREDSPWYPTARLFRQRRVNQWGEVIERVREALSALCTPSPGR